MLTAIDKALVGFAMGALVTLNQKYGFHFDTSAQTSSALTSLVDAALNGLVAMAMVYVFPNKAA